MANTHLSTAAINAGLDAELDVLGNGWLELYTGTQPASPDVAVTTQTKLAKCALSATAFLPAAARTKTANAVTNGIGLAVGTATWFRAFKADDTTAVIDGDAGGVGSSGKDMTLNDADITVGGAVVVSSWVISQAQ